MAEREKIEYMDILVSDPLHASQLEDMNNKDGWVLLGVVPMPMTSASIIYYFGRKKA